MKNTGVITQTGLLIQSAGLSPREAARALKKDAKTVRKWVSGEVETPESVTSELYKIVDLQRHAADFVLALTHRFNREGEIRVCVSDDEIMAQLQGWPVAAMMNGAVRRFLEMADEKTRVRTRVIFSSEPPVVELISSMSACGPMDRSPRWMIRRKTLNHQKAMTTERL